MSELKNIYNLRIGLADFWPSEEEKRREEKGRERESRLSLFSPFVSMAPKRSGNVATFMQSL